MSLTLTSKISESLEQLIQKIHSKKEDINRWLETLEGGYEFPLYSSVDIRDSGFKTAVIDSNLFPAGFNNLCHHGLQESSKLFRSAILKRVKNCQNVIVVAEEHTRNTWYLENVRILQDVITKAGFNVRIATFLTIQPDFCQKLKFIELETATGNNVRVHCFKFLIDEYEAGREQFEIIILNNDLINGIPEILKKLKVKIHPSIYAGWHSRQKSKHFNITQELLREFVKIVPMDLWLISCLQNVVDDININDDSDRIRLYDAAENLFSQINEKYTEHKIKEKPYIVIKADAGTYGMGVMVIEDVSQIKELSRKDRNKLYKGKGSKEIHRYLIQEGIPTMYQLDNKASEVCLYLVEQNIVGAFYRTNTLKGSRENLNTTGMEFSKICSYPDHQGDSNVYPESAMFIVYRILARISAIAAHREILQLEEENK